MGEMLIQPILYLFVIFKADTVQSAFKNLRRRYAIERNIAQRSSWKYFDQLSYLKEVIKERPRKMMAPDDSSYTNALDDDSKDVRLIEMVRAYPALYDSNAGNYGDVNHTDILWEIIGKQLKSKGKTFEFIQNKMSLSIKLFLAKDAEEKFKILSKTFEFEKRASENDTSFRSKWPFFERMTFVAGAVIQKQSKNLNVCRFCAKENVEMLATECTPDSTISQLFESVVNIEVSYFYNI